VIGGKKWHGGEMMGKRERGEKRGKRGKRAERIRKRQKATDMKVDAKRREQQRQKHERQDGTGVMR
jgi:hypothetical protein